MEFASSDSMDEVQTALSQQGAVIAQHSALLTAAARDFRILSDLGSQ